MFRFLRALIRNFGVGMAISIFFAVARGPAQPEQTGKVGALAIATASHPVPVVRRQGAGECKRPTGRVCRLADAGQPVSVP